MPVKRSGNRGLRMAVLGLAAILVLGGGFFGWQTFMARPAAPTPPVATKPKAAPAPTTAPNTPAGTPSATLNKMANAPANAVQKAKDAINARQNSGQTQVDPILDGAVADKPAAPAPKTTSATTGSRTVAPGLTASTALEAVPEASVAFRAFVANAKISGVVTTRAIVNGRLTRAGEIVDNALGISFEGYDNDKNQLLFKDRSGALVARRYP